MNRNWFLGVLFVLVGALAYQGCSCGDDDDDDNDDGGSSGGDEWCGAPAFEDESDGGCNSCVNSECCDEFDACGKDDACVTCISTASTAAECQANENYVNLLNCYSGAVSGDCADDCGGSTDDDGGGDDDSGYECLGEESYCTPGMGECCLGLVCCDLIDPPTCFTDTACYL